MLETSKKLAVVILNFNDYDNTIRYVNQIKKYEVIYKIVIVDNSLNKDRFDELLALSDDKTSIIKSNENGGYAKGNNLGINYLNEKYNNIDFIAISNPDVEVSENSYNECFNFLSDSKNKDVAMVAPRMLDANDNPHILSGWQLRTLKGDTIDSSNIVTFFTQKPHIERYEKHYLDQDIVEVACLAGSFFIIKKDVFQKVGYFDEKTFLYYEEDILGKKLHNFGHKVCLLNTCTFKHYEAVSVNKTMKYLKKYKIMQKSKRYYHEKYNNRPTHKLLMLDFVTLIGKLEIYYENGIGKNKVISKFVKMIGKGLNKIRNGFNRIINYKPDYLKMFKFLLYVYTYITLPLYFLVKKTRKHPKILYFSVVTWKWIKQRPHFIPLEISDSNKFLVDYRYQTLKDKYMKNLTFQLVDNNVKKSKHLKIKPFKVFPGIPKYTFIDNCINYFKTTLWNYDTIILTHPNQMNYFLLSIYKLRKTKIIYECMDNYETWEVDKISYRKREQLLIEYSQNVIVTAEGLKKRILDIYNINDNKIKIIRNGYDENLFLNNKRNELKLKHKNITYIGTIDDWFDFNSIISYAKNNKNNYVYIVGPVSELIKEEIETIKKENKNIIFTGPVEHNVVPQYIIESDVLIMPFIVNDLIKCVDPVKAYEYLYFKKPVVSTYWEELEQFKNLMFFYSPEENNFEEMVDKALNSKFNATAEYKKIMNESKWKNRVKEYLNLI